MPKLIYANGPFEVYKAGHVLIVNEGDELFCNLRKADRGFSNPSFFVDEILRVRAEIVAEQAATIDERAADYLAIRRARADAQPGFAF